MENSSFMYIIYFIIGGTIASIIYHFGKSNNTFVSAILPSIPVMFLTGFFILLYNSGNIKMYVKNSICTFTVLITSLLLLYFLLLHFNEYLCSFLFITIFILIMFLISEYKIIK